MCERGGRLIHFHCLTTNFGISVLFQDVGLVIDRGHNETNNRWQSTALEITLVWSKLEELK